MPRHSGALVSTTPAPSREVPHPPFEKVQLSFEKVQLGLSAKDVESRRYEVFAKGVRESHVQSRRSPSKRLLSARLIDAVVTIGEQIHQRNCAGRQGVSAPQPKVYDALSYRLTPVAETFDGRLRRTAGE